MTHTDNPTIVVFDSGLGGLTVFREIANVRPDARLVYWADDAFFPYSRLGEAELVQRVLEVMAGIIEQQQPDLVVVACNTASTLLLPHLRSRFRVPFVGTVPAIKPACARSRTRLVSVLGTDATVQREYTQGLINDFAVGCEVTLVGSATLAGIAEAALHLEVIDETAIAAEIAPCFLEKEDGRRTDVVVLACTHYPLLLERLVRLAPWPVEWPDSAAAIACRVVDLLGPAREKGVRAPANAFFSSGRGVPPALARYGIFPHDV